MDEAPEFLETLDYPSLVDSDLKLGEDFWTATKSEITTYSFRTEA